MTTEGNAGRYSAYTVEFTPTAAAQVRKPFAEDAYMALNATLRDVARDPWGQTRPDTTESSEAFRWTPFGPAGWVTVYVDDARRVVHVIQVAWMA